MQGMKARWLMPAPMASGYDVPLKHLSPVIAQILHNRGVSHEEMASFLHPDITSMHAPMLMHGMAEAVRRIRGAITTGQTITVYGDFDVDGVTATVLLHQVLQALGADCRVYIPSRQSEGYGLNLRALDALRADGVDLVVTVDCGISSVEEVAYARSIGLDVIVTDHHLPPHQLPDAHAILNPRQPLCTYPFKDLAGVGVAFKLASALLDGVPNGQRVRREVLDLVVIGTVADMVPLRGENRVLVRYGLPSVTGTTRLGLRVLLRHAGLEHADLTTADIGYKVGPRLNAAGRIDHALAGCRLLTTDDPAEAEVLATALDEKNVERQRLTALIIDEARARVGPDPVERALVVDDAGWPSGVIGLVAGRLAEHYCRPVFVIERSESESRGSARSVPGFNVIDALTRCGDLLLKYGGHAQAAGFSLKADRIADLRARLGAMAALQLRDEDLVPTIQLDAEIGGRGFGKDDVRTLYDQLAALEPFGIGNQPPVLMWRGLRVVDSRVVGNKHLRMTVQTPDGSINAIAFGQADSAGVVPRGASIDAVFSLQYNEWNGYASVELRVKDFAVRGTAGRHLERTPEPTPA